MTFLAPGFLIAAGLVSTAVVALHFIITRDPKSVPLPTARFVPNRPVPARARTLSLSDLLLMACRIGAVLLAGAALAQPVVRPGRRPVIRIILMDRSADVSNPAEALDSARALDSPGNRTIPFDSAAPEARISTGLIRGLRTASLLREENDSLELAIVAPFGAYQLDQSTDSLRALWPGAIRLVPVTGRSDSGPAAVVGLEGSAQDPLRLALSLSADDATPDVRVMRGAVTPPDSAWAQTAGHVLVEWPATLPSAGPEDTVGAVVAGEVVLVASMVRTGLMTVPAGGRVVARWVDGEPAAVETTVGDGCIRRVMIPVPEQGDLVLDPRFVRLAARLTARCGAPPAGATMSQSSRSKLAGATRPNRVSAASFGRPEAIRFPLATWLLGGALLLAVAELFLRRRRIAA